MNKGGVNNTMDKIMCSDFRKELKKYFDKVTEDSEPIIITRKGNPNAVLISEDIYNNMIENQFVLGNPANLKWLEKSKQQAESFKAYQHNLTDFQNKSNNRK